MADDISHLAAAPEPTPAPPPASATPRQPAAPAHTGDDISHMAEPTAAPDDISHMAAAPATAPRRAPASGGYLQTFANVTVKNIDDLVRDANEMVRAPTIFGKAWGTLKTVNDVFAVPFSPVEAGINEYIGKPLEEATGGAISAQTTGELGSVAASLLLDPINIVAGGVRALGGTRVAGDIARRFAPQAASAAGEYAAGRLIEKSSAEHVANIRIEEQLQPWRRMVNKLSDAEKLEFQDNIMLGRQQTNPALQPLDVLYRSLQSTVTRKLQWLGRIIGRDILKDANEDFLGIVWRHRDPKMAEAEEAARHSNNPLQGGASFLKRKKFQTISAAMRDPAHMAEFELATKDPIEMMLMKFREQNRFFYGTYAAEKTKRSGILKYIRYSEKAPLGWLPMPDRFFRNILPPAQFRAVAEHATAFDVNKREALKQVAEFLRVPWKTPLRSEDPILKTKKGRNIFGYTMGIPRAAINSRFGNELGIMQHELGHQIDFIFGLSSLFKADKEVWTELAELAKQRLKDPATWPQVQKYQRGYARYLMKPEERMANLFNAYWDAPELLQRVAPKTAAKLDAWLATQPDLKYLVEHVKGGVHHDQEFRQEVFTGRGAGLQFVGQWYGPPEAVETFKRYLEPSKLQTPLFNALRMTGMGMNQLQLGLSAFHATFVTVDTMISKLGQSIENLMHGEPLRALGNLAMVPVSPFTTARTGGKLRKQLLNPKGLTPGQYTMNRAFNQAGGRVRQEGFYRSGENNLFRGLRDGTLVNSIKDQYAKSPAAAVLTTPFRIAGAALNDIAHPIMEYLVPRQKLGVFENLASDWMRRNPLANDDEMQLAMREIWRSVDNRLGQLVYDNIFWSKTMKDLAFLGVRSVGWNMGTVRELGGGVADYAKAVHSLRNGDPVEFTHRMAYAIAMPIVVGSIGAMVTYMYNGHGPTEMRDYFFPPTGRKTPRGVPERIIIPSYIKDVLEVNDSPVKTALSKLNPMWATIVEFYNNRDFYGGIIHDPTADFATQAEQLTDYVGRQFLPFSVRSTQRLHKEGSPAGQQLGSFFGLQAAPYWITDPGRGAAYQRRQDLQALKRLKKEQATQ